MSDSLKNLLAAIDAVEKEHGQDHALRHQLADLGVAKNGLSKHLEIASAPPSPGQAQAAAVGKSQGIEIPRGADAPAPAEQPKTFADAKVQALARAQQS